MTAFHVDFASALNGDPKALSKWLSPSQQMRMAVYRNTILSSLSEALEAAFPAVVAALGSENFSTVSAAFARTNWPQGAALYTYGANFADWLNRQENLADLPWLGDLARIDRLWLEVLNAADETPSPPGVFATLPPEALHCCRVRVIASIRLIRFDETILDIWQSLSMGETQGLERRAEAEALLIRRSGAEVELHSLDRATYAFLTCCVSGTDLEEAAQAALKADPSADIAGLFREVLGLNILKLESREAENAETTE